jgi:hypothetical protein
MVSQIPEEYHKVEGQKVVWILKEIISLEIIRDDSLDGAEVYSEPVDLAPGEALPFNIEFRLEELKPIQTI